MSGRRTITAAIDAPVLAPCKGAAAQPVDGRTIPGIRNRQALIDAALCLFRERDYGDIAVRDISLRAGVGLGTFYNHFKDKDDLLVVVIETCRADSMAEQHQLRMAAQTFPEFVHNHLSYFFHAIAAEPTFLALMRSDSPALRRIVDSPEHLKGLNALKIDLEWAVEKGLLAPLDCDFVAGALRGVAMEIGRVMVRRCQVDPEAATAFAARLILSGMDWGPAGAPTEAPPAI